MPAGKHGAAAPALGYAYQGAWALKDLLRRGATHPDAAITIELHDDVAWEEAGNPSELLQLKHHLNAARSLTDMSDDLWSTLAVWPDTGQPRDLHGPLLTLVTTTAAAPGTAASVLRDDDLRDPVLAASRLDLAAQASKSEGTAKARDAFMALSPAERSIFVSRVFVLDGEAPIGDVDELVRTLLWTTLPLHQEDTFMALLWRWWDEVTLDLLLGRRLSVDVSEARAHIAALRDQFTEITLPTLVELADVDVDVVLAAHGDRTFVEQMRWVAYPTTNLRRAIVDYHRAVTQTTNWIDRDLIGLAELSRFEENLRDEWDRAFADMLDDLGAGADDATKVAAGKALLRALLASTAVSVRTQYNDPFFARGKRHELAEEGHIGWHPDFEERLGQLLAASA